MTRLVDAVLIFPFSLLFFFLSEAVKIAKDQKNKNQHVAGPAAKLLVRDKKKKRKKERKCDSRLQNRKRVELALSGCHLSAWHYASQMAGGKRASHQDVESNSGSGAEDGFV